MGTSGSATYDVEITKVFNAPVERVWLAWGDPQQIRNWWGPHGFTFSDPRGHRLLPSQLSMPEGIPDDGEHVVTFRALEEGRTVMTMVEHGYTTTRARDLSMAGLEQCLEKMADSLSRPTSPPPSPD